MIADCIHQCLEMSKSGTELPSRERGPPFYVAVTHVAVKHVTPVILGPHELVPI